jgi:hypothetical protein
MRAQAIAAADHADAKATAAANSRGPLEGYPRCV